MNLQLLSVAAIPVNRPNQSWRRIVCALILLLSSLPLVADFSGAYAPQKWTQTSFGGNGSLDEEFAPDAITLDSGVTGSLSLATFQTTIRVAANGTLSFDWNFYPPDSDDSYTCSLLVNGVPQLLSKGSDETSEGHVDIELQQNDVIGFEVTSPKGGDPEEESATLDIDHFTAPGQIPPPVVLEEPSDVSVCPSGSAVFRVVASGATSYLWMREDTLLEGQTGDSLELKSVKPEDAGEYSVVLRNEGGDTVTSGFLTVYEELKITSQPYEQTLVVGDSSVLKVDTNTKDDLSYQWFLNDVLIPGATQETYALDHVAGTASGEYKVEVKNSCTNHTAIIANITVDLDPLGVEAFHDKEKNLLHLKPRKPLHRSFVLEETTIEGLTIAKAWKVVQSSLPCDPPEFTIPIQPSENKFYRLQLAEGVPALPQAPTDVSAKKSSEGPGIDLVWKSASAEQSAFIIERAVGGGSFLRLPMDPVLNPFFTDKTADLRQSNAYRVRATNCIGSSVFSAEASIDGALMLSAPGRVKVSRTSRCNIRVWWEDTTPDETSFEIERSTNGKDFDVTLYAPANDDAEARIVDRNVVAGQTYWYRVRAVRDGEKSSYSPAAKYRLAAAPKAPGNLSLSITSEKNVRIEWQDLSNREANFEIERSTNGSTFAWIATTPSNPDSSARIVDSNVETAHTYWYRVRALKSCLASDYSPVSQIQVPIQPPSSLTLELTSNCHPRLRWTDNSPDETGFEIERSTDGVNFIVTRSRGDNSDIAAQIIDDETAPGQRYWYRVRAMKGGIGSGYSNTESIQVPERPGTPGPISLSLTSERNIYVLWEDHSSNETGFVVERSSDGIHFDPLPGVDANADTTARIVDNKVSGGQTYFYRVLATGHCFNSEYSGINSITVPALATPGPISVSLTSEGNARVEWGDNSNYEDGFVLQRRRAPDGPWVDVASLDANSDSTARKVDTEPRPGRTYCYRVVAFRTGEYSDWSSEACMTMPPAAPQQTSPECPSTGVSRIPTFRWLGVEGTEQYVFDIAADAPQEANIVARRTAVLSGDATSHSIPGNDPLSPNRTFFWRIRAQNQRYPGVWQESSSGWCQMRTRN